MDDNLHVVSQKEKIISPQISIYSCSCLLILTQILIKTLIQTLFLTLKKVNKKCLDEYFSFLFFLNRNSW